MFVAFVPATIDDFRCAWIFVEAFELRVRDGWSSEEFGTALFCGFQVGGFRCWGSGAGIGGGLSFGDVLWCCWRWIRGVGEEAGVVVGGGLVGEEVVEVVVLE